MADWESLGLSDEHVAKLAASAVTPSVAKRRGYWTAHAEDRPKLKALGFSQKQLRVAAFPALVVPMYAPGSTKPTHAQIRPAERRSIDGRPGPKYETPSGGQNRLDLNPRAHKRVGDPSVRLWVTEGGLKADALIAAGEIAVAITGVYSWRGKNAKKGSTALGDFERVAFEGREVFVVFDSDAGANPQVRGAHQRLVGLLRSYGADAKFVITPGDPDDRIGVDDFLAAGGTVDELLGMATDELEAEDSRVSSRVWAERFVERINGAFVYVPAWRRWLRWDGIRWVHDVDALRVTAAALTMLEEAVDSIGDVQARAKAEKTLVHAGRAERIVEHVMKRHWSVLHVDHDDIDARPLLLNTPGGVVNLETGEVTPNDPKLLMTRVTAGRFDRSALSPDVRDLTTRIVAAESSDWLQRFVGYGIRGEVTEEILVIFHGDGANAKTTLLEGLGAALGDYAGPVPSKLLTSRGNSEHPTIEADLFGIRLAWAAETEEGSVLAIERVKALTGGDRRKARRMREDYWDFTPSHTLILATNHLPTVPAGDRGTWRRIAVVEFPFTFTNDPAEVDVDAGVLLGDRDLRRRVVGHQAALDALVTWAVLGSIEYGRRGLWPLPGPVAEATTAYRRDEDLMGSFFDTHVTRGEGVASTEFVAKFAEYLTCEVGAERSWHGRTVVKQLVSTAKQHKIDVGREKRNGIRWLTGIRWKTDAERADDERQALSIGPPNATKTSAVDGGVDGVDLVELLGAPVLEGDLSAPYEQGEHPDDAG